MATYTKSVTITKTISVSRIARTSSITIGDVSHHSYGVTLSSPKYSGTVLSGATLDSLEISFSGDSIKRLNEYSADEGGDATSSSSERSLQAFVKIGSNIWTCNTTKKYTDSYQAMSGWGGTCTRQSGTNSSTLNGYKNKSSTRIGFLMVTDGVACKLKNEKYVVTITITYSYTRNKLTAPTVTVDQSIVLSDKNVVFTVSDPNKQNKANDTAATTHTLQYRCYHIGDPVNTYLREGFFGDSNSGITYTSSLDDTKRIWTYTVTPTWELGLCYEFGSQLVNSTASLSSDVSWSSSVRRSANIPTPLSLTIISEPRGNRCTLQWYQPPISGAEPRDVWYRISISPMLDGVSDETTYQWVEMDPDKDYQEYTISDIGSLFDTSDQDAVITVRAGAPYQHYITSGESNTVTFTYVAHMRIGYYGHEGNSANAWHLCTVHYFKTPAYLTKSVVEAFMDGNYYGSIDLKTRPIATVDDLDNVTWDMEADYDEDQTLLPTYMSTEGSILVLTPILEDGTVMFPYQLRSRGNTILNLGASDPVYYDLNTYTYHVVIDWIFGVNEENFNAKFAEEQNYIALLERLQRIYYFEAPAAAEAAKQAALDAGKTSIEANLAAQYAEEDYYAQQDDVLAWMLELDRHKVISGWVDVVPYRWNGNSWVVCTM